MLNSKLYDVLKFLAMIALPAFATFYVTLAGIWSLPASDQIVGTTVAVDTLLGVLLGISSAKYKDGTLQVHQYDEETGHIGLDLKDNPKALTGKKQIVLRIKATKGPPPDESATPGDLPHVAPPVPPGV